MESLMKAYDTIVAEVMGFMAAHTEENDGRNIVYVDTEDEASMFLFHCAMNVASVFGKSPVYIDCSLWDFIKMWFRYHKQIKIKWLFGKGESFDFETSYAFAARNNTPRHVTWIYKDIYKAYYKGDSKW